VSKDNKQTIKPSAAQKYVKFEDTDSQVILDFHEEQYGAQDDEEYGNYLYRAKSGSKKNPARPLLTKRSQEDVFDVPDLVKVLELENAKDIAVIRVPKDMRYCEHLVIATAISPRHLTATAQYIKKLYKLRRKNDDPFISVSEVDKRCVDWKVLDMQSIVLHLFLSETREKYDMETLWCVGEDFDDKTQRPVFDPVMDMMEKHIKFLDEMQPTEEIDESLSAYRR
jgi:ribosome silencing factor RsfS/YbeB/iojap